MTKAEVICVLFMLCAGGIAIVTPDLIGLILTIVLALGLLVVIVLAAIDIRKSIKQMLGFDDD